MKTIFFFLSMVFISTSAALTAETSDLDYQLATELIDQHRATEIVCKDGRMLSLTRTLYGNHQTKHLFTYSSDNILLKVNISLGPKNVCECNKKSPKEYHCENFDEIECSYSQDLNKPIQVGNECCKRGDSCTSLI